MASKLYKSNRVILKFAAASCSEYLHPMKMRALKKKVQEAFDECFHVPITKPWDMNANFTPPKISCYLTSMSCCAGVKMFEIPIYFALQVWPYFPKMYGRCQKPNTFFENCNRVFFTHEVKRHLPKKKPFTTRQSFNFMQQAHFYSFLTQTSFKLSLHPKKSTVH